ncbi:MAG: hypothetical protein JW927_01415 [Deltaproteobacteria bacterium]|nr:hypothetical protein [Deltaproteobacteria bacterium]
MKFGKKVINLQRLSQMGNFIDFPPLINRVTKPVGTSTMAKLLPLVIGGAQTLKRPLALKHQKPVRGASMLKLNCISKKL